MNTIDFLPAFEKFYKRLKDKKLIRAFNEAILLIRDNPEVGELKVGDLAGVFCYDMHFDKTNYEIAYRVYHQEGGSLIIILMAGTRENFYKELKRYIR